MGVSIKWLTSRKCRNWPTESSTQAEDSAGQFLCKVWYIKNRFRIRLTEWPPNFLVNPLGLVPLRFTLHESVGSLVEWIKPRARSKQDWIRVKISPWLRKIHLSLLIKSSWVWMRALDWPTTKQGPDEGDRKRTQYHPTTRWDSRPWETCFRAEYLIIAVDQQTFRNAIALLIILWQIITKLLIKLRPEICSWWPSEVIISDATEAWAGSTLCRFGDGVWPCSRLSHYIQTSYLLLK